jgi:kinesin family protein C1
LEETATRKRKVTALEEQGAKLLKQTKELESKYGVLEQEKSGLVSQTADLTQQLQDKTMMADLNEKEKNSTKEKWDASKHALAEAQVKAREEMQALRTQLGAEVSEHKQKHFTTNAELETVRGEKKSLATQLATLEVEMEKMKGDVMRGSEQRVMAEKDAARYTEEKNDLRQQLNAKGEEMSRAIGSFEKAQSFNEGRTGALNTELKETKANLSTLQERRSELEETVREFKNTLDKTQTELKASQTQGAKLTTTLADAKSQWEATLAKEKSQVAAEKLQWETSMAEEKSRAAEASQAQATELAEEKLRGEANLVEERSTMAEEKVQWEASLAEEKSQGEERMTTFEGRMAQEQEARKAAQEQWEEKEGGLRAAHNATFQQLETLQTEKDKVARTLETFKENAGVTDTEQMEALSELKGEVEILRKALGGKDALATRLMDGEREVKELRGQLFQGELNRRELHNKIQELRGNVRTIIRVRPFLSADKDQLPAISFNANGHALSLTASEGGVQHKFSYDKVFPTTAGQQDVFEEVANLVQSALDGYNVCLFSYGQTGSGKTHTMQGEGLGEDRGIIPRSIEKVMFEAKRLEAQGWEFELEASFVEIYNETLRDLLGNSALVDIKLDTNGQVHVPSLSKIRITTADHIAELLRVATKARAVAKTDMNARSSRSHSVFTLHVTGRNQGQDAEVKGQLNLCDLAGSERLSKSGATGDRLKETQAINKSLSALGDIFFALAQKSSHIPYRNSKLTHLLQPCFTGQGKTLMFANLSPAASSHDETLCSLRFASKVNSCELGKNKQTKNVKSLTSSEEPNKGVKRARTAPSSAVRK